MKDEGAAKMLPDVEIYTDGSCRNERGGYCALLLRGGEREEIVGVCEEPTNSARMELVAVIAALRVLPQPCYVVIRTDSQYVASNFSKLRQWQADGTLEGDEARANADLWLALREASAPHTVIIEWIRGHAECVENQYCHRQAKLAAMSPLTAAG